MPIWLIILLTAAGTALAMIIGRQFMPREKKISHELDHLYGPHDEQFLRSMGALLPPPILDGNSITPLLNGNEIFPAMLEAILGAQRTVTFETFVYWAGRIGRLFAEALAERARAGVKVHIALDWLGSKKMDAELLRLMRDAGVDCVRYHAPSWRNLHRTNNRTHRKILVVDGMVGFTGGVGIADEWDGDAENEHHWRDTHFRVEGPVVAQLQSAFMDNWLKTHSCVLHSEAYFPALGAAGESKSQVFQSTPDEGSESVRLMYLLSITAAEKSVLISSAYFVPDTLSVATLVEAKRRGVRVEIIVPGGHIDYAVVRRASRARWGRLLEAGVDIHEYHPTMYHTKAMVVDGVWSSVGSTNFDNRSFRLNDEANLNVFDADFAATLTEHFERDRERSRRITLEEWRNRPWRDKLRDHAAGLLRSQL